MHSRYLKPHNGVRVCVPPRRDSHEKGRPPPSRPTIRRTVNPHSRRTNAMYPPEPFLCSKARSVYPPEHFGWCPTWMGQRPKKSTCACVQMPGEPGTALPGSASVPWRENMRTLLIVLCADALKAPEQNRRCDMSGTLASCVMVLQAVALEVQPLVSFRPMGS